MITLSISAMRGPMLSMVSGFLGESGFGNDSHFSRYTRRRYSQELAKLPRNNNAEHSHYFWMVDRAWIRTRGNMSHLGSLCLNGPRWGMRLGPCDDDVMFGPWAQWGQGFFGPYNIHYNLGLLHLPIHKKKKKKKNLKGWWVLCVVSILS